ncbi:MAG: class I SAM-dependent methyltransferase [Clostridiales bacterium]
MVENSFEKLVLEAMKSEFSGWDFTHITNNGRMIGEKHSWSYYSIVKDYLKGRVSLLDMGTGGGEILSSLAPLPKNTFATEGYLPNVKVARKKLDSLGVKVLYIEGDGIPPYNNVLPFEDNKFDIVINRHEAYYPKELHRILKKGGIFITQQIGFLTNADLVKDILSKEAGYGNWNLQSANDELIESNFKILYKNEEINNLIFNDIGTVVYYLKAIPWIINDFSPKKYDKQLRYIHEMIETNGCYKTLMHKFIIVSKSKGR